MTEEKEFFAMDEEAQLKLLSEANITKTGSSIQVIIDGKTWHIRTTSQAQNELMSNLDYDILYWQNALKEAKQRSQKIERQDKEGLRKESCPQSLRQVLAVDSIRILLHVEEDLPLFGASFCHHQFV